MAVALPNKRALLREGKRLTHSERVRQVSLIGRDHAGTAGMRDLLDRLDDDLHQWQLRLAAATAAREPSDLLLGLRHPMRSVRSAAIEGLRVVEVDFVSLTDSIERLPPADRRALVRVVRTRGDTVVADGLIERLFERFGATEAATMLSGCSEEQAEQWLPRIAHGVVGWAGIARAHPALFRDYMFEEMAASRLQRDAWWERAASGFNELASAAPLLAIELWESHGPPDHIPHPYAHKLGRLTSADPARVVALLLRPGVRSQLPWAIARIRRRLCDVDDATLGRLGRAVAEHHQALTHLLGAVAPSRRAALFDLATSHIDRSLTVWDPTLLAALPHEVRYDEARRMANLPSLRDDELRRQELLVSLPIDETWDRLVAATHASDAELRASAYRRLVVAVGASGSPDRFGDLCHALERLRNEQDPVRLQAFTALRHVSPALVRVEDFDAIDRLVRAVVEARDSSGVTIKALTMFLQRVLADSAVEARRPLLSRSLDALATLAGRRGFIALGPLHRTLPSGGEHLIVEALTARLDADQDAGRYALLFSLVRALGPRGNRIPSLHERLRLAMRAKDLAPARTAISLWLGSPGGRGAKLGEIIDHDPSAVLVRPVFELVSLIRQDLIHTCLSRRALSGRFAPTRSRHVPLTDHGFFRWTPDQREAYAALLDATRRSEHTGSLRISCVRSLSRIPEHGEERLASVLSTDDVLAVEAALGGLSWGQRPGDSLATLLSYADGDRARVAIYSATRAARFATPDQLDRELRALLESETAKVTSRKEALRILGHNRPPEAGETFASLWERRPLHRDVTIALASALRNSPEADLTWEVHQALSQGSSDEALALAETAVPLSWPPDRRQQVAALVAPLVEHESRVVRNAAWIGLASWRPWYEPVDALIRSATTDLESVADWRSAVHALHRVIDGYPAPDILGSTVAELIDQPVPGEVASGARDQPIEQRLRAVAAINPASGEARAAFRAAGELLGGSQYGAEAPAFLLAGIDWDDPPSTLHRLAELGGQRRDVVPALYRAVLSALNGSGEGRWEPDSMVSTAEEFAAGGEPHSLIAAAIVDAAGPRSGWSDAWCTVLATLRSHPSPWTAHRARRTVVSVE